MLRYYEQSGLIASQRKAGYSYRVYDDANILRLQRVVILRKLQIPVKQIGVVLNNPDAATAIDIFKANISELQNEITALETIKSALEIFVAKIEEMAAVQLNLNVLTDDSVMKLAQSLSLIQRNVNENKTMDELNQASEQLNKLAGKEVRIVYRPPATMATINYNDNGTPPEEGKARKEAETLAKKFIEDTDLYRLKPDMRVFGFGDGNDYGDWNIWINIPDDLDVPAPFKKETYGGGLYAACRERDFDVYKWVQDSDDYEWDISQGPGGEEYFNPFNIYGLRTGDAEKAMYTDNMCPIREVGKFTDEQKAAMKAALAELDQSASRGEPVEIDLASMSLQKKDGLIYELNYPNGLIELRVDNMHHSGNMRTPRSFSLPLKIEVRAKTNKSDIHIGCGKITVILQCHMYDSAKDLLCIFDETDWKIHSYKKCGGVPANGFADIECFLDRKGIAVRVNGELRHYGTDYAYVREFEKTPGYGMSGTVFVGTDCGSTVTVEKLRVTEM